MCLVLLQISRPRLKFPLAQVLAQRRRLTNAARLGLGLGARRE
jgi:hypothetical protein